MNFRWEDPPDRRAVVANKWQAAADALRERPGDWAVLLEGNSTQCSTLVQYIKRGDGPFAPKGHFESLSRSTPRRSGTCKTYARFVGVEVEPSDGTP